MISVFKYLGTVLYIMIVFPLAIAVLFVPILPLFLIIMYTFDLQTENQISLASILSLGAYLLFILKTEIGGRLGDKQVGIIESMLKKLEYFN